MGEVYRYRDRETLYAGVFGLGLLTVFICALSLAVLSGGPFVLGTEMNANGTVEYLCLGLGCENFQAMDW